MTARHGSGGCAPPEASCRRASCPYALAAVLPRRGPRARQQSPTSRTYFTSQSLAEASRGDRLRQRSPRNAAVSPVIPAWNVGSSRAFRAVGATETSLIEPDMEIFPEGTREAEVGCGPGGTNKQAAADLCVDEAIVERWRAGSPPAACTACTMAPARPVAPVLLDQ